MKYSNFRHDFMSILTFLSLFDIGLRFDHRKKKRKSKQQILEKILHIVTFWDLNTKTEDFSGNILS